MRLVTLQSFAIIVFLVFTSSDDSEIIYERTNSCIVIPYPREFFYVDRYSNEISELVSEIIPAKHYDYWSYIGDKTQEFGDKKLNALINMDSIVKARQYSGKALTGIKNGNVEYYGLESISGFLGEIDNVTEAFLIAKSYGYTAHNFFKTDHYYIENGNYILTLSPGETLLPNFVTEVTVTKDGYLKSRFIKEIK